MLIRLQVASALESSQESLYDIAYSLSDHILEDEKETIITDKLKLKVEKSASHNGSVSELGGAKVDIPDNLSTSDCYTFAVSINISRHIRKNDIFITFNATKTDIK